MAVRSLAKVPNAAGAGAAAAPAARVARPGSAPPLPRPGVLETPVAPPVTVVRIGSADDPLEREADRLAEAALRHDRGALGVPMAGDATGHLRRACRACAADEERAELRRRAQPDAPPRSGAAVPPIVHRVLASPGRPLEGAVRARLEPAFGLDFSAVRIHDDALAGASADAVGAEAWTVGRHIAFAPGGFAPGTVHGDRLLAHELAHAGQQGAAATLAAAPVAPVSVAPRSLQRQFRRRWSRRSTAKVGPGILTGLAVGGIVGAGLGLLAGPLGAGIGLGVGALLGGIAGGIAGWLAGDEEGSVEVDAPAGACLPEQIPALEAALRTARAWLDTAIGALERFIPQPAAPANAAVRSALTTHFNAQDPATATQVRDRLLQIRGNIPTEQQAGTVQGKKPAQTIEARPGTRVPLTLRNVECHGATDLTCQDAGAYVDRGASSLVFCDTFFSGGEAWRADTVVHEIAHSLIGGAPIHDRGYQSERIYSTLSTARALTNAESFGLFVRQLATGEALASTAPVDELKECPPDWEAPLRAALAQAERWNRDALTVVSDRRPAFLAGWQDLQTRHLGGTTSGHLDSALASYRAVDRAFASALAVECETRPGTRCDASRTENFWSAGTGRLHVCPAWKALSSPDARATSVLAGVMGAFAGEPTAARRSSLANLARELALRFT